MPEEKKSDNTAFYVAIGAFVALIVIIIIFVIRYYNDGSSSDPQPGTNVTKAVALRSSSVAHPVQQVHQRLQWQLVQ